jgi:type IV pilus assembly protein PilP
LNFESLSGYLRGIKVFILLVAAVWLTGCAETESADPTALQAWMDKERAKHAPPVPATPATPAPRAVAVHPQRVYPQSQGVEPFSRQRLLTIAAAETPQAADVTRLTAVPNPGKPTLDALPLASMRLVGSVQRGGDTLALLRVQGLIYSVRVGDKIGQDQGRVNAITESGLVVWEVALNALGQASERVISLALVHEP